MKQKCTIFISLFFALFYFTGCEYELSGEFDHNIQKPADTHEGSITLSSDIDSIVICETTDMSYAVNSFGLKCNGIVFEYLDTKVTNENSSKGSFTITPDFSIKGWFDLKASFYMGTGTGSIADKFKAENYIGERSWKVRFQDLTGYDYKYQYRINRDGFLELFWIKPPYVRGINSSINGGSTIHPNITKISGDTTFFTDSIYFGGNTNYYTLSLNYKGRNLLWKTINPDYPFPELIITPFGFDSAVVSWDKSPLRQYYKVYYEQAWQHYIYTGSENSFKVKCPLGIPLRYILEIYPYDYKRNVYNYTTVNATYKNGNPANYKFTYSYVKDQFYVPGINSITKLEKVDVTTSEGNAYAGSGPNKYELWGNHFGTRFVGLYSDEIHIFNENLMEVNKITVNTGSSNYGGQMTFNNCFMYYDYNKYMCYIINVGDNPAWQQFSFNPSPADEGSFGSVRLSLDGKYAFWQGQKYFIIYDVSSHNSANIVYQCPVKEVFTSIGNPLNYAEIIVAKPNKIEVRSLPDFGLIRQLDLPGETKIWLLTIDTYSNSLLLYAGSYVHVINLATMKDILKFGASISDYSILSARLHRNNFFLNGTRTDLTPYLNKQ